MNNDEPVKLPTWVTTSIFSIIGAILGAGVLWGQARTDVSNLKRDVDQLKPLATAVAVINNEIPNIKDSVQEVRSAQQQMQVNVNEIQRDIKTILSQRGR